ncbi:Coniferyl aldehyde dehydrogenase [Rhodobacteraceae bacterium THAF1]|uniref:coniferyl aldehyde dehydrogenase n=1 Tax=Palleronia sp. THAF1 TaxID=2587842 RepID=UPI000F3FD577|nr:coniferyl aldehyde dehydrogenase [Palleronia sp. THAF1]QFU09630.1 Coniferyl aldehyde dehydrogenase [Palleronia sp. THAF1]VDC17469.1 Coniferyl aldehyde dehydrogenase [Rhodobacteraceae bacterium THAF1]
MHDLLEAQKAAFLRDGPPDADARRADLARLKAAILARRESFAAAAMADFGHRPKAETELLDLVPLVQGIDYLRANLRRWMRPEQRRVSLPFMPARARVLYQPKGVVGIMSPWNYPFALSLMPLATALAAGNRAILKPSEYVPHVNAELRAMLAETFPQDQVALVEGGADVGAAFAGLPFDHLVFTGGTSVGRKVMQAAAANLTPVTLELGGKSPAIVLDGADLDRTAASIAFGKLANGGQTCIAPDYCLVPRGELDAVVAALQAQARKLYPDGAAGLTHPIHDTHGDRLQAMARDAADKGARVIDLLKPADSKAVTPRLILNATDDMTVMQDEIFGPLLPIIPYDGVEDAIAHVNARPRPLALYVFGPAGPARDAVTDRTTSGNVTINDTLLHYAQEDLPFGGIGDSGIGAYHGPEGFRALSHAKGVFTQSRLSGSSLARPPYGKLQRRLIDWMMR